MRGTGCEGLWVLFSWVGPCSVSVWSSFLLMGLTVPSLFFGLRPNYGRCNGVNGALLQKDLPSTVVFSAPDPTAGYRGPTPPLETPGHSQASLVHSLVAHCSSFLGPGALWFMTTFVLWQGDRKLKPVFYMYIYAIYTWYVNVYYILYICDMCIHTHTHTHTHIYIYIYVHILLLLCVNVILFWTT